MNSSPRLAGPCDRQQALWHVRLGEASSQIRESCAVESILQHSTPETTISHGVGNLCLEPAAAGTLSYGLYMVLRIARALRSHLSRAVCCAVCAIHRSNPFTYFVKPFPSTRTTIQHPGSSLSSSSYCLTYSYLELAMLPRRPRYGRPVGMSPPALAAALSCGARADWQPATQGAESPRRTCRRYTHTECAFMLLLL